VPAEPRANHTTQACPELTAFVSHGTARSGKGLTAAQANQLPAAASNNMTVLA
jgi:hypothetical protein